MPTPLASIESLSQEIANLHLQGGLILDQPHIGEHIRRVTLAHILNAPSMGPPDHRLLIGGREAKFVELVANAADTTFHESKGRIEFILDDGFGRMDAWFPMKPKSDNDSRYNKQIAIIKTLRPFDYAHIEGKVHFPLGAQHATLQIISMRRVDSGWDIFLYLLQTLAEIDEALKASERAASVSKELRTPESSSTSERQDRGPQVEDMDTDSEAELPQSPSPKPTRRPTRSRSDKGKAKKASALAPASAVDPAEDYSLMDLDPPPEPIKLSRSRGASLKETQDAEPKRSSRRKLRVKTTEQDEEPPTEAPATKRRSNRLKGKAKEQGPTSPTSPRTPEPVKSRSSRFELKSPPLKEKKTPGNLPDPALRTHPMVVGSALLRYFRHNMEAATSEEGIALDANPGPLNYLMEDLELIDLTPDDLRDAVHHLIEEGLIYQTIDDVHYALLFSQDKR